MEEQNEIKLLFVAVIFLFTLGMSTGNGNYRQIKLSLASEDAV